MKYIEKRTEIEITSLETMGFTLPAFHGEHPNRVPFSGVLTRLDEVSSKPPNGTNGHRIIIPASVAQEALPTLIGMAVDMTRDLEGHDARFKIGVISEAEVRGRDLVVSGYLYGADFPDEVARIQEEKDDLGMSFESKRAYIDDPSQEVWIVRSIVFSGAAILYKDSAAYTRTSLVASAEEDAMGMEEIMAKLDAMRTDLDTLIGKKKEGEVTVEATQAEGENKTPVTDPEATAAKDTSEKPEAEGVDAATVLEKPKEGEDKKPVMPEKKSRGKKQFMKICKAMIDALIDEDDEEDGLHDPAHEDEGEDIALFRKLLQRTSAAAEMSERVGQLEKALEAAVGLLSDLAQGRGGLTTDGAEKRDGLASDNATVSAGKDEKPEDATAKRRTLDASKANNFLAKYNIEAKEYSVPEIDRMLRDSGVTDIQTRMAIKLQLEQMKLLKA